MLVDTERTTEQNTGYSGQTTVNYMDGTGQV